MNEGERVVKNSDGSVTVKLAKPVTAEGENRDSLTLREPTGKEWRKLDFERLRAKGDEMARIIGELAAVPPSTVEFGLG